jgi:hypothetical protein
LPGETCCLSDSGGLAGYQLESLSCESGGEPVTPAGDEFTASVAEQITCTFTSKQVSPTLTPTPVPAPAQTHSGAAWPARAGHRSQPAVHAGRRRTG